MIEQKFIGKILVYGCAKEFPTGTDDEWEYIWCYDNEAQALQKTADNADSLRKKFWHVRFYRLKMVDKRIL